MSLTVDQCRLAPVMDKRARELQAEFPGLVRYTSGLRTLYEQAHAMAVNHLQDPVRYLTSQYKSGYLFLAAVGELRTVEAIAVKLHDMIQEDPTLIDARHAKGNAVDILPLEYSDGTPTIVGVQVIAWIKACPDTIDFRTREGKLRRWHWACRDSAEV